MAVVVGEGAFFGNCCCCLAHPAINEAIKRSVHSLIDSQTDILGLRRHWSEVEWSEWMLIEK